ncbi:MAG: ABC transporter substrate-binding protein [Alphaproteobacteria bacterium]|nr:ABC transporter substrate-binding protein [Alphaproteobacteria bacterium]
MVVIKRLICLLMVLGLFAPLPARASTPAQATVQAFYTQLASTMKQGDKLGFAGRYKQLDPAIRAAFDLPLMTKLAVGSSWAEATPQEQADLVAAFSEFSVASYASQFAAYDGEQFTITGQKKTGDGGVMVETTLTPGKGAPVALNYLMRADDKGQYRIVDVYLNGAISQMATRRAEFSSIARRDGISALVNSLDAKSKQMGPS